MSKVNAIREIGTVVEFSPMEGIGHVSISSIEGARARFNHKHWGGTGWPEVGKRVSYILSRFGGGSPPDYRAEYLLDHPE